MEGIVFVSSASMEAYFDHVAIDVVVVVVGGDIDGGGSSLYFRQRRPFFYCGCCRRSMNGRHTGLKCIRQLIEWEKLSSATYLYWNRAKISA